MPSRLPTPRSPMRRTNRLREPVRHRAGRPAAACARYGAPRRTPPAGRLPARPDPQRRRISTSSRSALGRDDAAQPRLVVALDYRGRGRSDYDRDPDNYSFPVELADVLAVLTALEIGPRDLRRHLARRHSHDAARRRAARRDRRRHPQRHRPGDRAQGADADQGLCRQAAAAAQLRRRRRDPAPALRRAVSRADGRAMARAGAAHLDADATSGLVLDYDPKLSKTLEGVDSNGRSRRSGRSSMRSRAFR